MYVDSIASASLTRRDDDGEHWWYSREGYIVRWSLFLAFLLLITVYLGGGYAHARSRLRKGLMPLRYHRWMIKRSHLAQLDPRYAPPQPAYGTYRPADAYGMNGNMPPPPVYDPNAARPPIYSPPEGASKINPAQGYGYGPAQASGEYAPPPGPPPSGQQEGVAWENGQNNNANPFRG